ncbi:glycosyltransferase family 4 protein [Bacillus spongiae]|uniref:Glycosyltransferase family 4 protein n=1 Tax=Bacillus spongiae TaxID=2683610 RepID=A0ABU8HDZ1_9BACI
MKILFTTIFEYPHAGGLSTHISTLKKGLEERGHQVDVLSFSDFNPVKRKVYAQAPGFFLNIIHKGKGQVLNDQRRKNLLVTYLKERKQHYDVINSQDIFATMASIECGLPTVSTVHGYYSFEAISRGSIQEHSDEDQYIQKQEKIAYKVATDVVSVDRRISNYIKKLSNREVTIVKNFIDIEDFNPARQRYSDIKTEYSIPEHHKILFVPRRLTEKNGVKYPLLALNQVLAVHPDTTLVYAGEGEQLANLKKLSMSEGVADHIKLLGAVPHEKMKYLFEVADIVLVPSVHSHGVEEATSISALEAMGSGSPVIAGAVGGLKEIISHETDGILVEEKNVNALAQWINHLLAQPQKGKQLAQNARKKIEREYSHHFAAKKFESIYKNAVTSYKV